jgi:6-pyruvoyltetrahydropterin/6-carboxytetrahydropterin synthase
MFSGRKEYTFEASHQLVDHDAKCARLHGHSWKFALEWQGESLVESGPKRNMLLDYGDVSKVVKPVIESHLDHHHLNETLATDMPTSEFLARWLFERFAPVIPGLTAVIVNETCTSEAQYAISGRF